MRNPMLVLLATLVSLSLCPGTAWSADPAKRPEEFRGLKWGATMDAVPGLAVVERDGDIEHCDRKGDKLELGGIPLTHVNYSFYKGKFYHAEIGFDAPEAFSAVVKALTEKYGPSDAERLKTDDQGRAFTVLLWDWPGFVRIGARQDKDSNRGRVFYFYAPLTEASAGVSKGRASTYTVKRGDSLDKIAASHGMSLPDLKKANPGVNDKTLKAGQKLALPAGQGKGQTPLPPSAPPAKAPAKPEASAAPDGTIEYTVKEGDILSVVANSHGARTRDVIAANPAVDPAKLRPGTVLKIPVKKEPPAKESTP